MGADEDLWMQGEDRKACFQGTLARWPGGWVTVLGPDSSAPEL